jgi:ribosomal protein L39E
LALSNRINTNGKSKLGKQNLKIQNNAAPTWKIVKTATTTVAAQNKSNQSLINRSSSPVSNTSSELNGLASLPTGSSFQNDENTKEVSTKMAIDRNNQQQYKENQIQQDFKVGTKHRVLFGRLKSPTDIWITNADMRLYERFSKRLSEWYIMNGHSLEFDENEVLSVG